MSELNISDLPCEMLMKIMQHLDQRSMRNATLTCKLWNSLIEYTCLWSFNYSVLETECDREQKMNFIMATNRKFGTIRIRWDGYIERTENYGIFVKIFGKHGVNVVKVILEGYVDSLHEIANILSLTPILKHAVLNIHYLPDVCDLPSDYALPHLKELKKMEMFFNDQRLIKCFRKAKLTTMIIRENDTAVHYDSLVEFLSSQDTLTSLTVINYFRPRSILVEMGKLNAPIPLRLSKLAIVFDTLYDYNNLLKFIKSQTETLKQVEIRDFGIDAHNILNESVFSMTNLETLNVSIKQIPQDKDLYARLKKNHSVRTIKLHGRKDGDVHFVRNFFEAFPNVHSLILTETWADNNNKILLIARSLRKLESLSLAAVDGISFDCMQFWNLRSLQIYFLFGKTDWDQFTKNHSQLVELTIVEIWPQMFTIDDFHQIVTNLDLRCIRLGAGFTVDDQFFDIIRAKCKNLRELHLAIHFLAREMRTSVESINVLRLYNCVSDIICKETFSEMLSDEFIE